jgi:hypothetical protein
MKEIFKINLHSIVDVITNSSTELFIVDKSYGLEFVEQLVREKEKEFPADYDYKVSIFLDNPEWDHIRYIDTEDAIKHLKSRGYIVTAPTVETEPEAIMISCERGCISDELRKFIIETFNAEYAE